MNKWGVLVELCREFERLKRGLFICLIRKAPLSMIISKPLAKQASLFGKIIDDFLESQTYLTIKAVVQVCTTGPEFIFEN